MNRTIQTAIPELTIVVTFINISAYNGEPPQFGNTRKILVGPLYGLRAVQSLTQTPSAVNLWTQKCRRDVSDLGFDIADVCELIRELKDRDYRDSEWCENGRGAWAACDAYTLRRLEFLEKAGKSFPMEYYLKFALSKTGALLLMVSCHT